MLYALYRGWRGARRSLASKALALIYGRSLGAMGKRCRIHPGVYFANPAKVRLGDDLFIDVNCAFVCEMPDGYLRVGDGVQFNPGAKVDFSGGVEIGDGALISEGAIIYSHDHGLDPRSEPVPAPISIGRKAWVGVRALVMPSVKSIGDNAVIGAGSVVTRDVPANAVVAGNPARLIRQRD